MPKVPDHSAPAVPLVRLSSFYFAYYAALGAFTPYWALYLHSRGMGITAISVMMSLWYATRVVAPTAWATLAAASPRPIRWLRIGSVLTVASFACFLPQQPEWTLYAVMVAFCFFYNAVMPQFEAITLGHLGATPTATERCSSPSPASSAAGTRAGCCWVRWPARCCAGGRPRCGRRTCR